MYDAKNVRVRNTPAVKPVDLMNTFKICILKTKVEPRKNFGEGISIELMWQIK